MIFINLDNFMNWKKSSQKMKSLEERSQNEKKRRAQIKKSSLKKENFFKTKSSSLISLEEIYLSERAYEDITIKVIEKFQEYQKTSKNQSEKKKITLISPFNSEVDYLSKMLEKKDIEVLTIDKSQGIDRDLVTVLCTTRDLKTKDLLQNWKRVNVACTRAKSKLVLVGSEKKLSKLPVMEKFLKLIKENGWMYDFDRDEIEDGIVI